MIRTCSAFLGAYAREKTTERPSRNARQACGAGVPLYRTESVIARVTIGERLQPASCPEFRCAVQCWLLALSSPLAAAAANRPPSRHRISPARGTSPLSTERFFHLRFPEVDRR